MKKLTGILILALILIFGLAGCGSKSEGGEKDNASSKSPADTVKSTVNEVSQKSGSDIKVSMGQFGDNLKLPDSFPKNVVPILGDANIINVNENRDSKAIGITYTTEKPLNVATDFYLEAMKNANGYEVTTDETFSIISGEKENYYITVIVGKYEGDNVSVMLDIGMQNLQTGSISSEASTGSYYDEAALVDLPESYPVDLFPIFKGDKVTEAGVSEYNDEISFNLTVMSNKKIKELVDYYELSWGSMDNKYKEVSTDSFTLDGEIDKYIVNVYGSTEYDEAKSVMYFITITSPK